MEIQTRSILQHAWAEIEHDLGYKSKNEVPKKIRRRFSRLAGLLELADSEFNGIRSDLVKYDVEIDNKIQTEPSTIGIDLSSLSAFIRKSALVAEIDKHIAKSAGWGLVDRDDGASWYVDRINGVGIKTVGDLERELTRNSDSIKKFAEKWLAGDREDYEPGYDTHSGISLFYLIYILLAQTSDYQKIIKFFRENEIGPDSPEELAQDLLNFYEEIQNNR